MYKFVVADKMFKYGTNKEKKITNNSYVKRKCCECIKKFKDP